MDIDNHKISYVPLPDDYINFNEMPEEVKNHLSGKNLPKISTLIESADENKITGKHIPSMRPPLRKLEEGEVIMYDLESGCPYIASKEYAEHQKEQWDKLASFSASGSRIGKTIMWGTSGIGEDLSITEDIFKNPEKYSITKAYEKFVDSEEGFVWPVIGRNISTLSTQIYEFCNTIDDPEEQMKVNEIINKYGYKLDYDGRGDWVGRWIKGENLSIETLAKILEELKKNIDSPYDSNLVKEFTDAIDWDNLYLNMGG